jgi:hypothetical protein
MSCSLNLLDHSVHSDRKVPDLPEVHSDQSDPPVHSDLKVPDLPVVRSDRMDRMDREVLLICL